MKLIVEITDKFQITYNIPHCNIQKYHTGNKALNILQHHWKITTEHIEIGSLC